jgi:hypothetical protein
MTEVPLVAEDKTLLLGEHIITIRQQVCLDPLFSHFFAGSAKAIRYRHLWLRIRLVTESLAGIGVAVCQEV